VQLGNYVASSQAGSTVAVTVLVSDSAVTDANSARAEDIEGMDFTIQLGTGTGSTPSISTVDFNTNTVWTGNINGPLGGVDPASGNTAQFKAFAVSTGFDNTNQVFQVINPNGVLSRVTLSTAGAAVGQFAVMMVNTSDPVRGNSFFSDGLGNTVPSTITNGNLTIVSNQVVYWNGNSSATWDTGGNWVAAAAPTAAQDAYFGKPIPGTGATVNLSTTETVNNLWFDGSYAFNGGQITLNGGTITVFTGSSVAVNSTLAGAAGLTLSSAGGGTLTLGGTTNNTYTGDTNVNAGTLVLNKSGALAIPGGNLNVNAATVTFSAANQTANTVAVTLTNGAANAIANINASQTFGSLSGNGTLAFPGVLGPSLTVGAANTPTTFSGPITGAGNLLKTGSSTFTLSGSSDSVSAVTVNAGTLAFSTATPNLNGTTLGGSWTVNAGTLTLPAGNTVTTIGPTGNVALGAPTASFAAINGLAANQGGFAISGGKTFTTAGFLTNDGGIAVTGAGSALTVIGNLTNTGTPGASGNTNVGSGATLAAKSIQQNAFTVGGNVNITPKASGGGQSIINNLTIVGNTNLWTGKLNLADNSMIVNYSGTSPASTVANQLKQGYGATGKWDGTGGITSSVAQSNPSQFTLGYADGADNVVAGLPSGQVLVKYTRAGDANLSGTVDIVDLGILASHYGHAGKWDQGDFNYDGIVNVVDLGILATNYGRGTSLTASQAALQFEHDVALFPQLQAVPEPASIGLIALGGIALLSRRSRGQ
jgi:autotransporter-associated beta strand protein